LTEEEANERFEKSEKGLRLPTDSRAKSIQENEIQIQFDELKEILQKAL